LCVSTPSMIQQQGSAFLPGWSVPAATRLRSSSGGRPPSRMGFKFREVGDGLEGFVEYSGRNKVRAQVTRPKNRRLNSRSTGDHDWRDPCCQRLASQLGGPVKMVASHLVFTNSLTIAVQLRRISPSTYNTSQEFQRESNGGGKFQAAREVSSSGPGNGEEVCRHLIHIQD